MIMMMRRGSRKGGGQRGQASLQMAALAPIIILTIFAVVDGANFYFGRNAAQSAAAACAEAASVRGASAGAGQAAASSLLGQVAALKGVSVEVSVGAQQVTCTVTGAPKTLTPLPRGSVRQAVTMPKERLT